jgi:hypothetical protein
MIDPELDRPPGAVIQAAYMRVGNHFSFTVRVTNQSGVALSATANKAMVHAIVYEVFSDATRPKTTILTNTYVRATAAAGISPPLSNGDTGSYTLTTPDLSSDVSWNNLRMLALVDYRPDSVKPYDMLQAAFAQPASAYTITPSNLVFVVNAAAPADPTAQIHVTSVSTTMTWAASPDVPWLSVSPPTAGVGTPVTVKVTASALALGTQSGQITIQLSDTGGFSSTEKVPVTAYLGQVRSVFLPFVRK